MKIEKKPLITEKQKYEALSKDVDVLSKENESLKKQLNGAMNELELRNAVIAKLNIQLYSGK